MKQNNIKIYFLQLKYIGVISEIILITSLLVTIVLPNNKIFFCFIIGLFLAYSMAYANIYILATVIQKILFNNTGKYVAIVFLILSFIIYISLILFISLSYKNLIIGLCFGIVLPIPLLGVHYIIFRTFVL